MSEEKFDQWCVVELFGHNVLVGKVSETDLFGSSFARIDIPEVGQNPGFTKILHHNSIYSLTPVEEEFAKALAKRLQAKPITVYDHDLILKRIESDRLDAVHEELGTTVPLPNNLNNGGGGGS